VNTTTLNPTEFLQKKLSYSAKLELISLVEKLEQKKKWKENPLLYFQERLKVSPSTIDWTLNEGYENHIWDGTANPMMEILNALVQSKWVGVESATGTGKTFLAACILLWFLESFENSLVVTVAPKGEQLSLHLWMEVSKLFPNFNAENNFRLMDLQLQMIPGTDQWNAVGFTAGVRSEEVKQSATKAQGFHKKDMLIIFEETPGIYQAIMTAFQNTSVSPHNLILALGNPDHQLDSLHKFCTKPSVQHIRISALDHPNVVTGNAMLIPGATSKMAIERMEEDYGKLHPMYISRVHGISPAESSSALIKLDWCYKANERGIDFKDVKGNWDMSLIHGTKKLGVDVANSKAGDKAAIAEGIGNILLHVLDFQCPDSNQLGHQLANKSISEKIKQEDIAVDGVGVGAGTVNTLKEHNLHIYDIQSGGAPIELPGQVEQFNNLRSQMWWQAREDLRRNIVILPNDKDLFAELVMPEWTVRNGKIIVESKQDIKKRLGHSPNKGDAFVYWNWVRAVRGTVAAISDGKKKILNPSDNPTLEQKDFYFSERMPRSF